MTRKNPDDFDQLLIQTAWAELYSDESIDVHTFQCMKNYLIIDFDESDTLSIAYDKLVVRMRDWLNERIKLDK